MTNGLVSITPTITDGAYHANDVVGGLQVLTLSAKTIGALRHFQSIVVKDKANQKAILDLLFFNAEPADSTFDDNGAPTIHANDWSKLVGHYRVMQNDYQSFDSKAIATVCLPDQYQPLRIGHRTSLWVVITTPDTPTYVSTEDLSLTFGFHS